MCSRACDRVAGPCNLLTQRQHLGMWHRPSNDKLMQLQDCCTKRLTGHALPRACCLSIRRLLSCNKGTHVDLWVQCGQRLERAL